MKRGPKARVLIVDDEPDILLMLRVNLEAEGYETLLAGDGETAIRRIREEKPDLVVLDIMMPLMDGWGVLETISTLEARPAVIVLTAKAGKRDVARARELGADAYITKPFDPDGLIEIVEATIGRQHLHRFPEPLYTDLDAAPG